jgi:hypothetical protein
MKRLARSVTVFVALASAAPAGAQLVNQDKIRLNGYSNFEYEYSPNRLGRGDTQGSFDAQEFDLVFNILPSDRLRLSTDLRWEHGLSLEDSRGNMTISHGFAEYTVVDALRLRAGKMNVPFGIYNEIYTAKPAIFLYREPWVVSKPDKLGFPRRFFARSGTGVEALGNASVGDMDADYVVLVSNGDSPKVADNQFENDDNANKSITARVRVKPIRSVTLGASFYNDQLDEYDPVTGKDTGLRTRQKTLGALAQWAPGALLLEGEWIRGTLTPSTNVEQRGTGVYTSGSYLIAERFRPYVFYQRLDPNGNVDGDQAQIWGPGLNTRIDGSLFLKLEALRFTSGTNNSKMHGVPYTEFAAAVAVAF